MRENEKRIFERFVEFQPDFAGGPATWAAGNDPPDVLCLTGSTRVGVELAEWVDEWQIANGKSEERERESYSAAIRTTGRSPLDNIGEITLFVKKPLSTNAQVPFRDQLFKFLEQLDSDWTTREDSTDPQGVDIEDFHGFPLLEQYVAGLECYASKLRPARRDTQWLNMPESGSAFEPSEAVDSLLAVLKKKVDKYMGLAADEKLDAFYLLLFYDQGSAYNTPFEGLDCGFADVARQLRVAAASEHGEFDKIFLFDPFVTRSVEQVWP